MLTGRRVTRENCRQTVGTVTGEPNQSRTEVARVTSRAGGRLQTVLYMRAVGDLVVSYCLIYACVDMYMFWLKVSL